MDKLISAVFVLVFFIALFTGNLSAPPADTVRDHVFKQETKQISSLSEQDLIDAVVLAERRASNASALYDLLDDPSDFFIMNSSRGTQVLRLRCWGSYLGKPAHPSGGTARLKNRFSRFRATVQPEIISGHSLTLKITGDGRTLFSRVLTASSDSFDLEADVTGVDSFVIEISSDCHGSPNPGIYLKNALFF